MESANGIPSCSQAIPGRYTHIRVSRIPSENTCIEIGGARAAADPAHWPLRLYVVLYGRFSCPCSLSKEILPSAFGMVPID